ncbi:hypothetical protein KZ829_36260 [Actinoplanes hulinensis]|uniref:Lipoprotein n=1 Tax=Actinoplanes hulinensis TaxID=1144547 RepID=A0ABS7BE88_9ACTN|nr:hypothetical protein [Actinoplanes hulinensis]MBW6439194.1 hypothetical protein [Actinoplanes hulinensis]
MLQLLPPTARVVALCTVVLLAIGCDTKVVPFRLPQNGRQVPSDIIVRQDGTGALQFGFEMGTGLRTFVPTHLPYVLVAVALFAAPWWAAPVLGASFGLGRTFMVHSAVRSGNATAWDRRFATNRTVIVAACWAATAMGLTVLIWGLLRQNG